MARPNLFSEEFIKVFGAKVNKYSNINENMSILQERSKSLFDL